MRRLLLLMLMLLMAPSRVWADVSIVHINTVQSNGMSVANGIGGTVAAGDIVIVGCWGDSGDACSTPTTSPSETWTAPTGVGGCHLSDTNGSHGGYFQQCYFTVAAVGGWSTVTCNFTTGNFNSGCMAVEIGGCHLTCTLVVTNSVVNNTASTTLAGATVTPTSFGGATVSGIIAESMLGLMGSPGAGFSASTTSDTAIVYKLDAPTTLQSPTITSSGSNQSSSWTISISGPVFVQAASNQCFGCTTITATFGANVQPGHLVAVYCFLANATSVASLNAVETWQQPASAFVRGNAGIDSTLYGFYVLSAAGGWTGVTCTFSVSGSGIAIVAWDTTCTGCIFQTGSKLQNVSTNLTSLAAGGTPGQSHGAIFSMAVRQDTSVGISGLGGGSWTQDGASNAGFASYGFAHYMSPPTSNQQPTLTYGSNAANATSSAMIFAPASSAKLRSIFLFRTGLRKVKR